jgi:putative integral membrane protein (TIGR02587 family)
MAALQQSSSANTKFARGLARAFAGAIIFGFPLMMTMEMWWLGFYMDRTRLILLLLLNLVLLVPLSRCIGFVETHSWLEDVLDAFTAYGIAILASTLMLAVFAILTVSMPAGEIIGKIAVQSVPASIGAIIARGQLGGDSSEDKPKNDNSSYRSELLLMTVGALFLAFNVAPTEEMVLIAYKMTAWHALGLIILSIAALHAFVYVVDFKGQEELSQGVSLWTGVLAYSLAGFAIAILVSLYALWTFGRTDGSSLPQIAMMVSVLSFPAALGAGSARLIV